MLEKLAIKDKQWRQIAFKICKDKMLADDLVNEMYLKLANNTKEINDFYVIVTIKNLFLQEIKNKKTVCIDNFYNFTTDSDFEADDKQKEVLDNIYWVAKEYILMNETKSLREMAKELNTDYSYIHRIIKNEKKKWSKI
jgi:DNA-binding MarR family transcriptional regulator